jgi:hypothetical protein
LPPRRITERSIEIIDIIYRYRFIPTSLVVRLISGDIRTTERHLQNLYHQGLVNRFAFPSTYYPTEFNYYLDDKRALALLINEKGYDAEQLDYEMVKRNLEKKYYGVTMSREMVKRQGRVLHFHHKLMISRFHFMLEKACQKSGGKIRLLGFYQGSCLWNSVEVPKVHFDREGNVRELDETESLPTARTHFSNSILKIAPERINSSFSFMKPTGKRPQSKKCRRNSEPIFTIS